VNGKAPRPIRLLSVVDPVRLDVELDPWLKLDSFASYAGVSRRRLQDLLRAHPMPTFRPGGRGPYLYRLSDIDRWMDQWRVAVDVPTGASVDARARAFVAELRAPRP
jgi:Helix-turn-helix domain